LVKFEARNPKPETNSKFEFSNFLNPFRILAIWVCFGFRNSDFGFGRRLSRLSWKGLGTVIIALMVSLEAAVAALPPFPEVRSTYRSSDSILLDRNGQLLYELRTDLRVRRLAWEPLTEISPALQAAVVRAEDRCFFEHAGVDWLALAAAVPRGMVAGSWRGASTISMQLAAMLDKSLQPSGGRRSLRQKWGQVEAARMLEGAWSKAQILEAYLNLVFFRGDHQGVAAASRRLFGKAPHGLDAGESLVLAALIRSPNAAAIQVESRAIRLGRALAWAVTDAQIRDQVARALPGSGAIPARAELAAHAGRRIFKGKREGAVVGCTLDHETQRLANERLTHHLEILRPRHVAEGAALVVENTTGEVIAYASRTADPARSRFVDGVAAKRQAGSTLKPFLYALAIDRHILTAASRLADAPLDLSGPTGIYQPRNYDRGFQGTVAARIALASSLNIPAVRVLEMAGVEAFLEVLRELGIRGLSESGDFYGPSLALGTADVSLWELVNAYRALANGGIRSDLVLAAAAGAGERAQRVFSPQAAFIVSDILADRDARSPTFGLENPLATRFWTAVKTGTSKDMRDNWCVGYSQRYSVGVWFGNFSGESMRDVSGMSGAAPVWLDLMNHLHRTEPSFASRAPDGMVRQPPPGAGDRRPEWFVHGTEPVPDETAPVGAPAHIVYPPDGAVLMIDPDIPPERQKIVFAASGAEDPPVWVIDGKRLSAGAHAGWNPAPGRHALSLLDPGDRLADTVVFQVRGPSAAHSRTGSTDAPAGIIDRSSRRSD
jgi:penicillin-binding protein 1C